MPSSESPSTPSSVTRKAEIQNAARMLADGQVAESLHRLEVLAAAFPAYATSQVLLAKAYEASGRAEDALNTWHRAYFLVPGSPLVRRERMRLMRAQYLAAGIPPPVPDSPPPVADLAEPTDTSRAAETEPDEDQELEEAPGIPSTRDTEDGEPFAADELPDDSLEDDLHEVFVDDSDPVSDALGPAAVVEMWADEHDAEDGPLAQEEPIITGPAMDADIGEPVADASEGEAGWWRRSTERADQSESGDADDGWTVVDELETSELKSAIIEPEIAAPAIGVPGTGRPQADTAQSDASLADDLDTLIRQLEDAPRIRPDANFVDENDAFAAQETDDNGDDMVSETLARIYVAQGQYVEAANVYRKLAKLNPGQASEFEMKATELRARVGGVN